MNQLHHREFRDFSLPRELCAEGAVCRGPRAPTTVFPLLPPGTESCTLSSPQQGSLRIGFKSERNLFGMVKKMGSLGESKRGNEARKPVTRVFEIL